MGTFGGNSTKDNSRLVLVVGYCRAGESVHKVNLLLRPDIWTDVQPFSKVDRYIVVTPKLTVSRVLSPTNRKEGMAPLAERLEKNWEPLKKNEWIEAVAKLRRGLNEIPSIASPDTWIFPKWEALEMDNRVKALRKLNEPITTETKIDPTNVDTRIANIESK